MTIADTKDGLLSQITISKKEWQDDLEKRVKKFHIIGAWIAIIFDPIFGFTDFLNIREHFPALMGIRISVSLLTLLMLYFYRKYDFASFWVVLVPFMLISFQNAYTFMYVDESSVLGHCMNYIALFIGGGMFILWPVYFSLGVVAVSISMTYFFFHQNPDISSEYFWIHGGLLKIVVEMFMIILINFRYNLSIREIKSRLALEKSKELLGKQKQEIQSKNELLVDSLQYAKRIQDAILGDQQQISDWFKEAFIFFIPKDIVSGDFYWIYKHPEKNIKVIIASDCTGHGVPAALMTVLGNSLISDIVDRKEVFMPDKLLRELDMMLLKSLKKRSDTIGDVNDGMDIAILTFIDDEVYFSAAKNPLVIIKGEEVEQIKGSKFPIGGNWAGVEDKTFERHKVDVQSGDKLYIFSDGFQDQFGGPKGKKYMTKKFRTTLLETSVSGLSVQGNILDEVFNDWKGELAQTDDVLVIGIEI